MAQLTKNQAITSIRSELRTQYDRILAAAREAHGYATDQDSKAEGKYDTRSLEASYLAEGQAAKAEELAKALQAFETDAFPVFADGDAIDLGALVEVVYPDRTKAAFLLASHGGGVICEHEGTALMVVSPGAPIFAKLTGLRVGDRIDEPELEIRAVS